MSSESGNSVLDGVLNIVIAASTLFALARFILWYMEKVVNRTMDRNEHLEERLEKLEHDLEHERDNHNSCRAELAQHKIESAAKLAEMSAQIEMLMRQVNRPRRSTDPPEGDTNE